ncbi:MAG: adenylate/guanylate cyclase domain-containing protein [Mariprofundus sp.]|nr:adenylate/guanylate cyclase domain-containing protein [Mariprofundus sp.]
MSLILLVALPALFYPPVFLQLLENKSFDARFLMRGPHQISDKVVIVGIDDQSLEHIGRWPWPRKKTAELLSLIAAGGPKAIGIDMLFSEPDQGQGASALADVMVEYRKLGMPKGVFTAYLQKKQRSLLEDAHLAAVIQKAGNVVLPVGMFISNQKTTADIPDVLYDFSFMLVKERPYNIPLVAQKALVPIEDFSYEAAALGHVYTQYDLGGAIRWEPLYIKIGELYMPSFSLELARLYLGYAKEDMQLLAGEAIVLKDQVIETDRSGRVLIDYAGPAGTFKTLSALDIFQGKIKPSQLRDKIVLLGVTALGGTDTHVTPFSHMPGVEKQANVLENILQKNFLRDEEFTKSSIVLFVLLSAVILLIFIPKGKMVHGSIVTVLLLLLYLTATQYLFEVYLLRVDLLTPSVAIILMYSVMTAVRFLTEERIAKRIKSLFSNYTTEKVVDELIAHPELAKLGGTNRDVTVLFSDVRSFTVFSESRSPEVIVHYLNELLSAMTDVIFEWDGTLDKFVGDEIMAFWGAPSLQEDHAALGTACSLSMLKRLAQLHQKWADEGVEPLDIGIGLNSGEVLVGNIGCEHKKMDYTIIGDHVNLGARVEALTRKYDAYIIITEFTYEKIKDAIIESESGSMRLVTSVGEIDNIRIEPLGDVKVKGKANAVAIYRVSCS